MWVELAGVGAEALLVLQEGVHAAALLRRPRAVEAQHDLVPDVDGEARAAREDVEGGVELVRAQVQGRGLGGGRARALLELAAELAARERDGRPVPEARDDPRFHVSPSVGRLAPLRRAAVGDANDGPSAANG